MKQPIGLVLLLTAMSTACGSGDSEGGELTGETVCARWASLASIVGCEVSGSGCEEPDAACTELGIVFIDCVATDLDQCYCESDGDLNCEGAWKSNEGPALCVQEMSSYNSCVENQ
jgi:hypothetical protein